MSANLTTNFKPNFINCFYDLKIKKIKQNKQIYCKNFLIYLLLIKKNTSVIKSEIYVKKLKKKIFTVLKAPYRYKIARHQLSINRYNLNFSIKILVKKQIILKNWLGIIKIFNFVKSFQKVFESNIVYTNSLRFNLPLTYKNNFTILNYNNK